MDFRATFSRHRGAVMGIAALMILLFHTPWASPFPLYNLAIGRFGNIAVDFFLYASGFGLAYSLRRDDGLGRYMGRRISRVLPAYYAYVFVSIAMRCAGALVGARFDVASYLFEEALPIGIWLNFRAHKWFVSAILGYYVAAALLFPLIRKSRYVHLTTAALVFILSWYVPSIAEMNNVNIAITRFPALVMGLASGEAAQREACRRHWGWTGLAWLAVAFCVAAAMAAFRHRLSAAAAFQRFDTEQFKRTVLTLMGPLLAVVIALLFELMDRMRLHAVERFFSHLGSFSLELYLVQNLVYRVVKLVRLRQLPTLLITVALCYPAARGLAILAGWLLRLWRRLLPRLTGPDGKCA